MKTRTTIRYLSITIGLCTMMLPLSSQADVYWSLKLGHGLELGHSDHHQYRQKHVRKTHKRKHSHHRPQRLQHYYRRHRAYHQHHYYDASPYGFIPRDYRKYSLRH